MVTERPNAGAVRHYDRCVVIRLTGFGGFVPIVAHGITLTDIAAESCARCLVRGVFRTKVPGVRALLCKSGPGLKLQRRIRSTLVSPVLAFDQVFGCTPLEQASGLETYGARVRMSSYVLDHGTSGGVPDASRIWEFQTCVGVFELRSG